MKNCLQEYQDCNVSEIAEKYIEGKPKVAVAPDETNATSMIHDENIKKVYSVWSCMNNPPKNRGNNITRYSITEENLVGNVKESKTNYDLMATIMICLGKAEDKDYTGVLKLLDVLLSTETNPIEKCQILGEDFEIEMTQTLESEVLCVI